MQDDIYGHEPKLENAIQAVQSGRYRAGFDAWLRNNFDIFKRFAIEAEKVRSSRRHYSARTIIEYIRHETTLRENDVFKINNNVAPDCARLYMALRGCHGFFDLRGR
jgi:hypothetical protein